MKFSYILCAAAAILMTACHEAPTPPNNAEDLEHDEASRITLTLTPGRLVQPDIDNAVYATGFVADPSQQKVAMDVTMDEENETTVLNPSELRLKPDQWYEMRIDLYNHAGANINRAIRDFPEQVNAHQFYLRTFVNDESQKDTYVSYRYGDTDDRGELIGTPLGFVGYVRVSSALPANAQLNLILVHIVPPAVKLQRSGTPYPFHTPPPALMRNTDVNFRMPLVLQN